jgi:hypothetical protein
MGKAKNNQNPENPRGGRKKIFDGPAGKVLADAIGKLVSNGCNLQTAVAACGADRTAVYKSMTRVRMKQNPSAGDKYFFDLHQQSRQSFLTMALETIIRNSKRGDSKYVMGLIDRCFPDFKEPNMRKRLRHLERMLQEVCKQHFPGFGQEIADHRDNLEK